MSNLIEHAKREFKRAGYTEIDIEQEDGPNLWIQQNVLDLIKLFSEQGHSGFSAGYCIDAFQKLANYKLLSPIKNIDEFDFNNEICDETFQSKVISSVFKDPDGRAYYLDATYFRGQEEYDTFSGRTAGIQSRQYIKYPFIPKTFPIDVKKVPFDVARHDDYYEGNNSEKYAYEVVNRSQLKEIEDYYDCDFGGVIVLGEG